MKKYRVSLACKVYCNFEQEIKAKSEKDAIEKAVGKFNRGAYDIERDITEPNWTHYELEIDLEKPDSIDSGIYTEELE